MRMRKEISRFSSLIDDVGPALPVDSGMALTPCLIYRIKIKIIVKFSYVKNFTSTRKFSTPVRALVLKSETS